MVFGDFPNYNWIISSIKLLNDQFRQNQHSLIKHSPKALNYRIFFIYIMECQHFFQNLEIGSLFQIYKKDQIFLNLNKL